MTALSSFGPALLESDCRYFELGADLTGIDGGVMASMGGLEKVAGACVVQRVEPGRFGAAPSSWVRAVIARLRDAGWATARIYLDQPVSSVDQARLDAALVEAGFEKRIEIGYAAHGIAGGRADVRIRPITGEHDWEAKLKLHAGTNVAADGHAAPAEEWVELERRKCGVGGMEAFLVEVDGAIVGAVATLDGGPLLRAKNLFVDPDRRREGIASGVMRALCERAVAAGKDAVGIFGVPGNPGDAVYRRLGMEPVAHQFEWSLDLGRPAGWRRDRRRADG